MDNLQKLKAIVIMASNYCCNLIPQNNIEKLEENQICPNAASIPAVHIDIALNSLPSSQELSSFFDEKLKIGVDKIVIRLEEAAEEEGVKILFLKTAAPVFCLSYEHVDASHNVILRGAYAHMLGSDKSILRLSFAYKLIISELAG